VWFPTVYDVKFMMRACKQLKGGLQEVADDLGVRQPIVSSLLFSLSFQVMRIGSSHQAGSDSLLTASTFFKMREIYFNDHVDDSEYNGKLYGLGQTFSPTNGIPDPGRGSAATIAEREDRGVPREQTQTPGPMPPMHTPSLGTNMPSSTPYGPINGGYMRTMGTPGR
jgi:CCR4-NOT transcription complex subunit 7/8